MGSARTAADVPSRDTSDRVLRGRLGAYVTHSRHDSRAITAAARKTFLERFEREVDPDGALPPDERRRRAEHARKAYFTRLQLKSAQARRKPRDPIDSGV